MSNLYVYGLLRKEIQSTYKASSINGLEWFLFNCLFISKLMRFLMWGNILKNEPRVRKFNIKRLTYRR